MNTKLFYTIILNLLILSLDTKAQLKELNFKEVFDSTPKDLLNPIPLYRGWADDSHYIEYRIEGQQRKPYTVDVRSGEAVPSAPAQVNEASVSIKNKDIFYKSAAGVEKQLTAAAKVNNKPIAGLETMEFQLGIFDTLPEADQIAFLVETAKMIDDTNTMMDKMVNMWGSADTESLAQLMNEGMTSRTLYDALLTKRNANWAKWISAQMKKPGVTFMAVGAGHLAGSTSVQALLPAYGLTATRVAY